jgi:hypothetical protein
MVEVEGYEPGEKTIKAGTMVAVRVEALTHIPAMLVAFAAVSPYVVCRLMQAVPVKALRAGCEVFVEVC